MARTVDVDLLAETAFLAGYDTFKKRVSAIVDMPDRLMDLVFRFLYQNAVVRSNRAREREFANLTDGEAWEIQSIYSEILPTLGGAVSRS